MNTVKWRIVVVLFLCFAGVANAQTKGCLEIATGRMYYQTPTPASSTTYFVGSGYYDSEANCTSQYYSVVTTSNTNCYASYDGSGPSNSSSNYYITGKKRTFNVLNCPIDEYTLSLLAIMGSLGVFYLRRMVFN